MRQKANFLKKKGQTTLRKLKTVSTKADAKVIKTQADPNELMTIVDNIQGSQNIIPTSNAETFRAIKIAGDGNCLFRSIAFLIKNDDSKYQDIRTECVHYVYQNWEKFGIAFVGDTVPVEINTPEEYVQYMLKDCVYGTNVELCAISEIYQLQIIIIQANTQNRITIECDNPTKTIYLQYSGAIDRGHYDALIKNDENEIQILGNDNMATISRSDDNSEIEQMEVADAQNILEIKQMEVDDVQINININNNKMSTKSKVFKIPTKIKISDIVNKKEITKNKAKKISKTHAIATTERNPKIYSVGSMTLICKHCKALYFELEKNSRREYNKCCNSGSIILEDLPDHPQNLKDLLQGHASQSKHFKRYIIKYNNCFQFVSMQRNLREIPGYGPYVYAIQGQIYHHYSDININRENQKYGPIYFLDPEEAIEQRMKNAGQKDVKKDIIKNIADTLNNINPFAKQYRHLHDVYEEQLLQMTNNNIQMPQIYLKFIGQHYNRNNRETDLPQVNEVAAVCQYNEDDPPNAKLRVFLKNEDNNMLHTLDQYSELCDPLAFPILFPYGNLGWTYNLKLQEQKIKKREYVTICQFYAYRLSYRKTNNFQIIQDGGALLQQYVVASFLKIEANRIGYIRMNQDRLRTEEYYGLVDYVYNKAEQENVPIGRMIILPSSYQMGPRSQMQKFQDAMAVVSQIGCPSLFITITCNPRWNDIVDNLPPNETVSNHPFLINRVFIMKLNELMHDLTKKNIMGTCIAYIYVIEFQKRGLPHAHILITLTNEDKPKNPDQIDQIVSAEIPDPVLEPQLYKLVSLYMVHGPCGEHNKNSVCMINGKCSKHFPMYWQNETTIRDGNVLYRRRRSLPHEITIKRNNKVYIVKSDFIVPYNPYLLCKYNTHINIVICTSSRAVKYLYKYFFKGPDQAVMQVVEKQNESHLQYNEINSYLNGRYMTPPEASWHILKFPMHSNSHHVIRLQVHLPNRHHIIFKEGEEQAAIDKPPKSQLIAWFELNKIDPNAATLLYNQIPLHYVWNKNNSYKWSKRRNHTDKIIARICNISVKQGEQYYLRLLLLHVAGATSFEDLKTVNGVVAETFHEACKLRNLLAEDIEWSRCLTEASFREMPKKMRHLFAYILAFCEVLNAKELWQQFRKYLIEDYIRKGFNEADAEIKTLQSIQRILLTNGTRLSNFDITEPLEVGNYNDDDIVDMNTVQKEAYEMMNNLNLDQKYIFNTVMNAIENENTRERHFFVQGAAGTGKTYLYNAIISATHAINKKVCTVAWTGIAASLLKKGRTVHSQFKIPIPIVENSTSAIKHDSALAQFLRNVKLIIWDEVSMTSRKVFELVNTTLQEICQNKKPFGGKCVVIGGDFKQCLPVVLNGDRTTIIAECIKQSKLWQLFQSLELKINMRVNAEEQEFASWLAKLGNGQLETLQHKYYNNLIQVPNTCIVSSLDDLIIKVFGSINNGNIPNKAILTPLNCDCHLINQIVLNKITRQTQTYISIDSVETDNKNEIHNYPAEFLHSLNPSGFPQHEIQLKEGSIIMLLRNLNVRKSLCNGTRLLIHHLGDHILDCERIMYDGKLSGEQVFIPRIDMISNDTQMPFKLKRRQFPVRLAYAITINKAQGQTLDTVGIYLPNAVFSHGQLYVAFSRAKTINQLFVFIKDTHQQGQLIIQNEMKSYTRNIVYPEILF